MKKVIILALILICVSCAGCFKIKCDLIITSDGAVLERSKFVGTAALTQQIENWKNQAEKNNPSLKAKAVVEGEMRGYKFDVDYPDIESFAQSAGELYRASAGKNRGISQHKGWFFDDYDFDFYWTSYPVKSSFDATVSQALFSQAEFDVSIALPYSVESTNADEVGENGKLLKWHLSHVTIHGGEKYMQAHFKIWHEDKVVLTALAELLLLAATSFFFIKARAEKLESVAKDLRFKRNVFASLFIALAMLSTYMVINA